MSNAFAIEENYRETGVRQGNPIGGYYKVPSSIATDTWHRLMPSGNAGAVVASSVDDYKEKLNIGTLRSDITNAPIGGWMLFVLNQGYQAMYQIRTYDPSSGIVHLMRSHREDTEMTLHNLPAGSVEFVIFPITIVDFKINYKKSATDAIEIGFQPQDKWGSGGVQSLGVIEPGQVFGIPTQRLDRLMFKFDDYTSGAENFFSWGEHYIA